MGQSFVFGSELKALVAHPEFKGDVSRDALALYLRYNCIPAPYSIYREVKKLPPATKLPLRLSNMHCIPSPRSYWSAQEVVRRGLEEPFAGSEKEANTSIDASLRDAATMRMLAFLPLGAVLYYALVASTRFT